MTTSSRRLAASLVVLATLAAVCHGLGATGRADRPGARDRADPLQGGQGAPRRAATCGVRSRSSRPRTRWATRPSRASSSRAPTCCSPSSSRLARSASTSRRMPVASDETEKSVEARADAAKLAEELRPRIPTVQVRIAGLGPGRCRAPHHRRHPDARRRAHRAAEGRSRQARDHRPRRRGGAAARGQGSQRDRRGSERRGHDRRSPGSTGGLRTPARATAGALARDRRRHRQSRLRDRHRGRRGRHHRRRHGDERRRGSSPPSATQPTSATPPRGGSQDLATARTWANVSTVAFTVGGAGVVAGVVGLLHREEQHLEGSRRR